MNPRNWGAFASTLCLLTASTAWGQTRPPETPTPTAAKATTSEEKPTQTATSGTAEVPKEKPTGEATTTQPSSKAEDPKKPEIASDPKTDERPEAAAAPPKGLEAKDVEEVDPADPHEEEAKQQRIIDISAEAPEAPEEPPKEKIDPSALPFTYHQLHIDLAIGLQIQSAQHNGLEPFIGDEVLPEVFFRAGGAFYRSGPLALAVMAELGTLSRHSEVRGDESHLALTRLNLGLEGRYHFHHRLFASLRLAPGAEFASMDLGDEYAPISYSDKSWKFATDASAGVALRFLGSSDGRERTPRAWVFLEGGAHLAGKHSPTLEADEGSPERPEPIVLDPFTTSGPFLSLGVMGSY